MKRHEYAHGPSARPERPRTSHTAFNKSCSACARSRVKCYGGQPCNHCAAKSLSCTYLPRKRKRSHRASIAEPPTISAADHIIEDTHATSAHEQFALDHTATYHVSSIAPSAGDLTASDSGDYHRRNEGQSLQNYGTPGPYSHSPTSHGDRPSLMGPMSPPQLRSQSLNSTHVNWLPFDQSNTGDLALPTSTVEVFQPVNDFETLALRTGEEGNLNASTHIETLMEDETSLIRHNRMSALITSMRTGLPGLSETSSGNNPTKDRSKEKRHFRLYADGDGARTSQSDRSILERRESHAAHGEPCVPSQSSIPPWMGTLQAKVQNACESNHSHFTIPDVVLEQILTKIHHSWVNSPFSIQYSQYGDVLLQKETLEYFIQHYFENFHTVYPFLDQSLLCIPVWGWALCLAAAAIGARYCCVPDITVFGDCLCSLLHEVLLKEVR